MPLYESSKKVVLATCWFGGAVRAEMLPPPTNETAESSAIFDAVADAKLWSPEAAKADTTLDEAVAVSAKHDSNSFLLTKKTKQRNLRGTMTMERKLKSGNLGDSLWDLWENMQSDYQDSVIKFLDANQASWLGPAVITGTGHDNDGDYIKLSYSASGADGPSTTTTKRLSQMGLFRSGDAARDPEAFTCKSLLPLENLCDREDLSLAYNDNPLGLLMKSSFTSTPALPTADQKNAAVNKAKHECCTQKIRSILTEKNVRRIN
eukprot:g5992.t1